MCKEISCCFCLWIIKKIKLIAARLNLICNCNDCNLKQKAEKCNSYCTKNSGNKEESEKNIGINDASITDSKDDRFGFCPRIVKNICGFLERKITPSIIAVTGPWGCGKSSVLNLLEERTKDKYEIIKFNSIIECKFEVKELLEFFLLKLLSACTPDLFVTRQVFDRSFF